MKRDRDKFIETHAKLHMIPVLFYRLHANVKIRKSLSVKTKKL